MGRRGPAKISERYLQWVTNRYLQRYSTSEVNLRRLLGQRVYKSARHHEVEVEPWMKLVDDEIARLVDMGALDDGRYAYEKARSLHGRGNSSRAIRSKLAVKGVPSERIDEALARLGQDGPPLDLEAALTFARKRRMGPWARERSDDWERRKKELGRFARAGFGFDIANRVLNAEDEDAV